MTTSLAKREEVFPFFTLKGGIDKLFEDFFSDGMLTVPLWKNGTTLPALDVKETDESILVEAELPGLKQNEIEVKVEEGVLSIKAERKQEKDEKTKNIHRSERYYGLMERHLAIPGTVEGEKVEAAYKDGVLTVTLPKKASAKPKAVAVKVK